MHVDDWFDVLKAQQMKRIHARAALAIARAKKRRQEWIGEQLVASECDAKLGRAHACGPRRPPQP